MSEAVKHALVIRRGLRRVYNHAKADFETGMSDNPPRWSPTEATEFKAALDYIRGKILEPNR